MLISFQSILLKDFEISGDADTIETFSGPLCFLTFFFNNFKLDLWRRTCMPQMRNPSCCDVDSWQRRM